MYGYIYETTNLINGKKYIGKHKSNKFDSNYYGSGTGILKAIEKYGKENFKVRILEEIDTNQKDLDCKEVYYIEKYNAVKNELYYNNSYGGENEGWFGVNKAKIELGVTKETKLKMSKSQQGHPSYFRLMSEKSRIKISKTLKDWYKSNIISDETRYKIGSAMRGKHHSKETKEKISNSLKGRKLSKEHLSNLSKACSGKNNGMYGKIYINNGFKNKLILPNELDYYLNLGYIKGMVTTRKD